MRWIRQALLRVRAVVRNRGLEDDMQEEMRDHLARAEERFLARGMSGADARIAARREFGNVGMVQEEGRDARGARWLDALRGDLRFSFRYFGRNKAYAFTIIAVLTLGIGTNTAIFSAFQAELVRPAPAVPRDDAHVRIHSMEQPTGGARWVPRNFTYGELAELRAQRELFEGIAAWIGHDVVLDPGDSTGARGVGVEFVTPNYFALLGVPLAAGSMLAPEQADGADMSAIMSFRMARQFYGSAEGAVGRRIVVNELPVRIVGVAPERFQGAVRDAGRPALWLPISARAGIARVSPRWHLDKPSLTLFARLAPAASREQATALARQVVTRALPDSAARVGMSRSAWVLPMQDPPPSADVAEQYLVFGVIGSIGLLILLVACTNVSSMMVAAAMARKHEIAVRLSLGASRARLLRQLLTESSILSLAGGAGGLLLYWWLASWVASRGIIQGVDLVPDVPTFVFMMALALGTGVLFGLSPALHATRSGVANAMRDSGGGATHRSRLQRALVVAQIVFSQPLLLLLGVMLSLALSDYEPMPESVSQRVIAVTFRPLSQTGTLNQRREAVDSLMPRLDEHPEIMSVVPQAAGFASRDLTVPEAVVPADSMRRSVIIEGAAPGWFALQDVPILLGRDVSFEDTAAAEFRVVVGSDFARLTWGGANPLGRRFHSIHRNGTQPDSMTFMVVGVFDETRANARGVDDVRMYTARGKHWRRDMILVRTRGSAESFIPELRRMMRDEAPALPVTEVETLAQIDAHERQVTLQVAALAAGGAAVALLLASLGLYGVIALAVNQRRREIGIRIAVGAKPIRVARMFLASGVRVGILGLLIGLPVSVAALQVGLSVGVIIAPQLNVWLIGAGVALTLLVVASVATWIPARRAAWVDPAVTLRDS